MCNSDHREVILVQLSILLLILMTLVGMLRFIEFHAESTRHAHCETIIHITEIRPYLLTSKQ